MDPGHWEKGPALKWALGQNGPWAQMGTGTRWALGPKGPWVQMAQAGPGQKSVIAFVQHSRTPLQRAKGTLI